MPDLSKLPGARNEKAEWIWLKDDYDSSTVAKKGMFYSASVKRNVRIVDKETDGDNYKVHTSIYLCLHA